MSQNSSISVLILWCTLCLVDAVTWIRIAKIAPDCNQIRLLRHCETLIDWAMLLQFSIMTIGGIAIGAVVIVLGQRWFKVLQ